MLVSTGQGHYGYVIAGTNRTNAACKDTKEKPQWSAKCRARTQWMGVLHQNTMKPIVLGFTNQMRHLKTNRDVFNRRASQNK